MTTSPAPHAPHAPTAGRCGAPDEEPMTDREWPTYRVTTTEDEHGRLHSTVRQMTDEKCRSCSVGPLLGDEKRAGLCDECGAYNAVHGHWPDDAWVGARVRRAHGLTATHEMTMREPIRIKRSPTADTRTCDFANVSKATLYASSEQHINDVRRVLEFFAGKIIDAMMEHDTDKLTDIDGFHADFVTGFAQTGWWDRHRQLNRHHLNMADGVRDDVNLIDVLDYIADCVMAGMARSGSVYPLELPPELLAKAFQNTVTLLKSQVVVVDE